MADVKDDISYMRRLAEQGRRGPILGGTFLAAAGVVFGGTCFVQWAGQDGLLPISGWGLLYLWLGAFGVFALVWFALFFRLRARAGSVSSASNAAFGVAWSSCGVGVLVAFAATEIVAAVVKAPIVLNAYVPMIFAFYGVAWFSSAAMARRSWMFAAAAASFAFAFIMAALAENRLQTPMMGVALLLLLTVPGFRLMVEDERQ